MGWRPRMRTPSHKRLSMIKKTIAILIILSITISVKSQCKYYNKVDKEGKKTGLWLSYWDKEKSKIARKFHYNEDWESGLCKMYNKDGKLKMKERHLKNRIRIKSYNEIGKLQRKGWGIMEHNSKDLHFYWHGHWKFYGEKRHLTGISVYENGAFIESIENNRTKRNQTNL